MNLSHDRQQYGRVPHRKLRKPLLSVTLIYTHVYIRYIYLYIIYLFHIYISLIYLIRQSLPLHTITIPGVSSPCFNKLCVKVDYGNVVNIDLSSAKASKFQAILNDAACLIGTSQSSPMSLLS